jgi:hypothetical protein
MLAGTIIFSALNFSQQRNLIRMLVIFDAHQQAEISIEGVKSIFALQQEFYNQFYADFTQVAGLPAETFQTPAAFFQTASEAFADYSDQIAFDYKLANTQASQPASDGKIAGAMIDKTSAAINSPFVKYPEESLDPPQVRIPYSFEPLQWQPIQNALIKIWVQ